MSDGELSTPEAVRTLPAEPFARGYHAEGRGAAWVSVRGELDLATASQFKQTLREALEQTPLVIVDLRALTFLDSTGSHAIVDADAQARRDGHRIVLIGGSGQVDRLCKLVGLGERLRIVDLPPGSSCAEVIAKSRPAGSA